MVKPQNHNLFIVGSIPIFVIICFLKLFLVSLNFIMLPILNRNHLINIENINKYLLIKNKDIFKINNISLEVILDSNENNFNLSYKFFFFFYLFSNSFSFIHYKIIPTVSKDNKYSIKLEAKITNKNKIILFIDDFILEKKKLLKFKSVLKTFFLTKSLIQLCLTIPLKQFLLLNFINIKTISALNYDTDSMQLKFNLKVNKILFSLVSIEKCRNIFSFWRLTIKTKYI